MLTAHFVTWAALVLPAVGLLTDFTIGLYSEPVTFSFRVFCQRFLFLTLGADFTLHIQYS